MKLAVVGGGAAGLAAAAALQRGGADVALFEAEPRLGGKIHSHDEAGFHCEDGPNSLQAGSPTALRLSRQLRLNRLEARPPGTRWVVRQGRLFPFPSPAVFSPLGWARLAAEPLAAALLPRPKRAPISGPSNGGSDVGGSDDGGSDVGGSDDGGSDESLREFMVRHFGEEAGELGATLMANGIYAGDPRALSARSGFARMVALEEEAPSLYAAGFKRSWRSWRSGERSDRTDNPRTLWTFNRGMAALPQALGAALGDRVHPASPVEAVSAEGGGYRLRVSGRGAGELWVDGLVCALQPKAAGRLLAPMVPEAAALGALVGAPLAVVHVGYRDDDFPREAARGWSGPPRGFGLLDGDGSLDLLGALFPSSLFVGRAPEGHTLLTCMLGGMLHPEVAAFDAPVLLFLVRETLRRLFGVQRSPVFQRVFRWSEAVPQPLVGHAQRIATVRAALQRRPGLELAGAAYDGAAVEQALAGGERAAERLLACQRPGVSAAASGAEADRRLGA